MINYIKERMRQRTPLEMITQELALAHLAKLEAETAVDYAKSVVAYNDARIKRLEFYQKDKSLTVVTNTVIAPKAAIARSAKHAR